MLFGWLSTICFSLCALPQAYRCYKTKDATGLSSIMLALWFIGEICAIIYVLPSQNIPLLTNYVINLIILSYIIKVKLEDFS